MQRDGVMNTRRYALFFQSLLNIFPIADSNDIEMENMGSVRCNNRDIEVLVSAQKCSEMLSVMLALRNPFLEVS
jgi:hypothetical protein